MNEEFILVSDITDIELNQSHCTPQLSQQIPSGGKSFHKLYKIKQLKLLL